MCFIKSLLSFPYLIAPDVVGAPDAAGEGTTAAAAEEPGDFGADAVPNPVADGDSEKLVAGDAAPEPAAPAAGDVAPKLAAPPNPVAAVAAGKLGDAAAGDAAPKPAAAAPNPVAAVAAGKLGDAAAGDAAAGDAAAGESDATTATGFPPKLNGAAFVEKFIASAFAGDVALASVASEKAPAPGDAVSGIAAPNPPALNDGDATAGDAEAAGVPSFLGLEEPKENGDCVVAFGSSAATVFASSSFFGLEEPKEKGDTGFAGAASAVSSFFCGDPPKENGELEEPKENGDCVVAFGSSAATVFASSSFFGLEEPKEKGDTGFAVAASAPPSFFCGETEACPALLSPSFISPSNENGPLWLAGAAATAAAAAFFSFFSGVPPKLNPPPPNGIALLGEAAGVSPEVAGEGCGGPAPEAGSFDGEAAVYPSNDAKHSSRSSTFLKRNEYDVVLTTNRIPRSPILATPDMFATLSLTTSSPPLFFFTVKLSAPGESSKLHFPLSLHSPGSELLAFVI